MDNRFFIGDTVRTVAGMGTVRNVTTWRDRIIDMSDAEATEFCAQCKAQVGIDFRDKWVELLVAVGGRLITVQAGKVELLKGRYHHDDEERSLAFAT